VDRSWNWPAALCFFPWALYRKMWLWAFAVPVATTVVTVVLPSVNSARVVERSRRHVS
jgi:hypothetical protein